jgi:hypothetical protein
MLEKMVHIDIKLPQKWFDLKKLSMSDFQKRIDFLGSSFGFRFTDVFATDIHNTNDANYILQTSQILQEISDLPGFSRFVNIFNRNDASAYLFSARTAILLKDQFEVELEPEPISQSLGRMPDLKIRSESKSVFIECKTINADKFFKFQEKSQIAKRIRSALQTPNQISFFFDDSKGIINFFKKLTSNYFVNQLVNAKEETNILEEGVKINVIPRRVFSDTQFTGFMKMIMEDHSSGERKPGFVFMESGQSTGVFGPLVDFSSCLEKKRRKSRTQSVNGFPYILAIDASYILGAPDQNLSYIKRWFQPKINTRYSGILLCKTFSRDANSYSTEVEYLKNDHSSYDTGDKLERFFQEKVII